MTGARSGTFSGLVEECFLRELAPLEFASVAVEDHDTLVHSESLVFGPGPVFSLFTDRDGLYLEYICRRGPELYRYALGSFLVDRVGRADPRPKENRETPDFPTVIATELRAFARLLVEHGSDVLRGETGWLSEYPDEPRRVGQPMAEDILRALPVGIPECVAPLERERRRAVGGPSAMRDELVAALARMEALLRECGWNEQADWLSARRSEFASLSPDSPSFHEKLRDLDAILAGMGSLSDVPMYPKEGSALTVLQARQQHWDLIALIDSLVSGLRRRAARRKGRAG